MRLDPRRIAPILILIVAVVAAIWYLGSTRTGSSSGPLTASGTIEAKLVNIASEVGGKLKEISVDEGGSVLADQVLVSFDSALLQAQIDQARSALKLAETNYDLVAAGQTEEQQQLAVAIAKMDLLAAQQAVDALYDNAGLIKAKTEQEIAQADKGVDTTQSQRDSLVGGADTADIDSARAAVVLAKDQLDKAQEDFAPYQNKSEDNLIRAALLGKLSEAQNRYDSTVRLLNNLLAGVSNIDLSIVDAQLALVEAQKADAERRYATLANGPDPDALALAQAMVDSAHARLQAAEAGASPEQLAVAQAQVDSAQAALNVLVAQLERMTIESPISGIVLERSIEPGEVALPGTPLLTLGRLDDLTITVYVSEDRYGEIKLGEKAQVTVDSFSGEIFNGTVVHIADQSEYTPRNVQTQEGRSTTVFAIKLAIDNLAGKLKPGMPADVTFEG